MTGPPLPSYANGPPLDGMDERLRALFEAAHRQWISPLERRRMRAFGFRPAVETGVLKREWRGLAVRVGEEDIRASRPGEGELVWRAEGRTLELDGVTYEDGKGGVGLVEGLLDLIAAYERWVEAREGREERIMRARPGPADRRPVNALAETRRLQRLLHQPRGK
jgi:hypothetical protein